MAADKRAETEARLKREADMLRPYRGQYVAVDEDGLEVLVSGPDPIGVAHAVRKLNRRGVVFRVPVDPGHDMALTDDVIIPFRALPGEVSGLPRPVIDLQVGPPLIRCWSSGFATRGPRPTGFGSWVATVMDLDLDDIEPGLIGIGGQQVTTRDRVVTLVVDDVAWEAPVSFCEPWPWDYHLLGQEGFFRWFETTIRAADRELELVPIER